MPARPVRFAPQPARIEEADGLVGLIAHICRDLANERGLSAVFRPAAGDGRFAAVGIACDPARSGAGEDSEPAYLRRAEAHIRAHRGRSVGVSELVAVTGVSERTLQQAFRRYRDCSPLDYSRDIRLDFARAAMLRLERDEAR